MLKNYMLLRLNSNKKFLLRITHHLKWDINIDMKHMCVSGI